MSQHLCPVAMFDPTALSNESDLACVSTIPNKTLNQLVDFHETQQRGHAVEGDLDAIIFNPVASKIPKWRTFKLVRWV
jgi:hypothetical protein